jgi:hypothetical protein
LDRAGHRPPPPGSKIVARIPGISSIQASVTCRASSSRARPPAGFTGGMTELEVEANNFRRMVLELDRRFPGLGRQIDESMAVAIDGEIFQDAYLVPLNPDSEIYLIPKIGGG